MDIFNNKKIKDLEKQVQIKTDLSGKIEQFIQMYQIKPNLKSIDPQERQLAEASKILKKLI